MPFSNKGKKQLSNNLPSVAASISIDSKHKLDLISLLYGCPRSHMLKEAVEKVIEETIGDEPVSSLVQKVVTRILQTWYDELNNNPKITWTWFRRRITKQLSTKRLSIQLRTEIMEAVDDQRAPMRQYTSRKTNKEK